METPAPTAMENNNNLKLNIDSDEYQLMFYIERSKLVFKLQNGDNNPDKIFQKDFLLNELKQLNPAFRGFDNLEDVRLQFSLILNNEVPKAEKKENSIDLIINIYGKKTIIPLKKFEMDLNYDNLSEEMKKIIDENKIILGIDLGTTYSCASVMLDDHVVIMENSLGLRTTPSYVCFFEHDKICVGELAKLQPSYEYKNIIYNVKRLFGRNINDKEIKEIIHDLPFDLEEDKDLNQLKININFKTSGKNLNVKEYYPEQVAALILKKLIKDSEYYLAKKLNKEIKIKDVVITVPAYFNQKQREATYQAAKIINLDVKRMINEPTAASLAYGYKEIENNEKLITVLDFGGGTLDLTLLKFMKCGNNIYYDVKFSFGDTHFGGEDFDYILMKKCLKEIGKNDMNKKLQCNIRLKRACEIAKIKLSTCDYTNIILEEYSKDSNINFILTKKEFENLCHPIFTKFEGLLNKFLKSCGYENRKISEVILIGGTTLIPKVEEIIKKVFKYSEIKKNLNPKEAVARGAAIQAGHCIGLGLPESIRGLHDIYIPLDPPNRREIPIYTPHDRAGSPPAHVAPKKVVGVVKTSFQLGKAGAFTPVDDTTRKIGHNVVQFLINEMKCGRIPKSFLPLQSGVGNIANAVLDSLEESDEIPPFEVYTEVMQDTFVKLLLDGHCKFVSTCSLTLAHDTMTEFFDNIDKLHDKVLMRPSEISNNPEVIRRLGVISMNTAIEADIFGNINSSHVSGTRLMNGIGGSGDFTRNAYTSIFMCPSIKKDDCISTIVPMCTHVDHTIHSADIIVTDQGVADLRFKDPVQAAEEIIENAAHPIYRPLLREYLKSCKMGHVMQNNEMALAFHCALAQEGDMRKAKF